MKTLRGPTAYYDIVPALDAALYKGGARVQCGTEGAAIKLVQRMNQYRILDRKINMKRRHEKPLPADFTMASLEQANRDEMVYLSSEYDGLIIKRVGTVVILERRPDHPWIEITDMDGNPIEVIPRVVQDPERIKAGEEVDRMLRKFADAPPIENSVEDNRHSTQAPPPIENKAEDIIKGLYEEEE